MILETETLHLREDKDKIKNLIQLIIQTTIPRSTHPQMIKILFQLQIISKLFNNRSLDVSQAILVKQIKS